MIKVIATIRAYEDHIELVKASLQQLVEPSRLEQGCLSYDFFQDVENTCLFYCIEQWADKASLDEHLESPHIKACMRKTEAALAAPPQVSIVNSI
jgi:quinol monooxygenase YgiN